MGSIEVFPRKPPAGTLADVWRVAAIATSGVVRVREARLEDYAALRALQRHEAPDIEPVSLKQLESRRHAFPEGQMVAMCDGQLVGAASALVVDWDVHGRSPTWKSVTGEGFFTTHDPAAGTLYGAELLADDSRHGFSVARALLQARRRLCRRMNLRRIVITCALAGYAQSREALTPERYAMRVIWGDIPDAPLRFLMAMGFQYCGVLHGYRPKDAGGGHAALLAWLNPLYTPPRPPAYLQSERTRKCA